jgi:hypothetical protein
VFKELDLLGSLALKSGGGSAGPRKNARFSASLITTFNGYLPFYEDVILRRLIAAGCQHNVLLMDAFQWRSELARPLARPRLAGSAYTLVPVTASRAFHPKIGLLVGAKHARIIVGSHNVTLSGFGGNREITTRVEVDGSAALRPLAVEVWRFLEAWLSAQAGLVPDEVLDSALLVARRFAPWLNNPAEPVGDLRFIGSHPAGPSLWSQLPLEEGRLVRRVTAMGAFIDHDFGFLRHVDDSLRPQEFVVGIEPDTVSLNPAAEVPKRMRFVDSSALGRGVGYLHAKALLLEFEDEECLLVTGSPNLSSPAWLNEPSSRNAEAAFVHSGAGARLAAEDLDLFSLQQLRPISNDAWDVIKQRLVDDAQSAEETSDPPASIALVQDDGLAVYLSDDAGGIPDRVLGFQARREDASLDSNCLAATAYGVFVSATAEELASLSTLDLLKDGDIIGRALVHDPGAISRHTRTGAQQTFREALDGLAGDSPDIASVVRLAERMIFDVDAADVGKTSSSTGRADEAEEEEEGDQPIGSLIVVAHARHRGSKSRGLRSTDLGYLMDILIHSLGKGLGHSSTEAVDQRPSEEELIGADDDEALDPDRTAILLKTVRICQGKVRTLVTRMIKQLARAHDGQGPPGRSLQQLMAVLSVLRELRRHDLRLRDEGVSESVVPLAERQRLVRELLALLFERGRDLYEKALRDFGEDPDGDLPMLRGLLLWLAWDAGMDARGDGDPREPDPDAWLLEKARLVGLVPIVVADEAALEEATKSILTTVVPGHTEAAKAKRWLDAHIRWGKEIVRRHERRGMWTLADQGAERGMMAVATREQPHRIRVVRGFSGTYIRLTDFGESKGARRRDFVTFGGASVVVERLPAIT